MSGPSCIGIIMDGNRRWAKEQDKKPWEGHFAGNKKFKEVVRWAKECGVPNIIVYAFSTENWKRSEEEVGHILSLMRSFFSEELKGLAADGVRVRFAGDLTRFPEDIRRMIQKAEADTSHLTSCTVMIAASYGGRAEIVRAAQSLIEKGHAQVTEEVFAQELWTAGFPDPDMVIRTGGEYRLSNFLPWQATYSELFFTKTLWPVFSREEFEMMLTEYARRKRNFGT